MSKKIYDLNTTAGKRYAIGTFNGDELISGPANSKYYKSQKAAQKALDDLID